jgi:hypothetical protein
MTRYYNSKQWKALRIAALTRDMWRCAVPGCRAPATIVDHVVARQHGGTDALDNLRCYCALHDNQVKEDARGNRRSGGKAYISGCNTKGIPLDLEHWWNKK